MLRRTLRVLDKAKRAASQGTRKKGRTVGSVQGRDTPPKVPYKMSKQLAEDVVRSKIELGEAHLHLKDAAKK